MDPDISNASKEKVMGDNNSPYNCGPEQIEIPFHIFQDLSSKSLKFQSLCRICLKSLGNDDMIPLHSTYYETETLVDIIKLFTSIQINLNDVLPLNICITCQADVIHCYKFKIKFEKSEYILQTLLKEQFMLTQDADNINSDTCVNNSTICKDEVKEETIEDMDEQYLEDNVNFSSDDEALCIVQNTGNKVKDELEITITDSKSLLKKVMSHKESPDKQKSCSFCHKKFSKIKNLRDHIRRKHSSDEHSHPCTKCKEIFSSEHDLKVHSAVHSTGPPWSCNTCDKVFKAKPKLRRHLQRHMQAKRFACACGKAFSELYALRRHARVHTGQAPDKKHACPVCDKRYSESSALAQHVAGHRGERPCVCAVCGKAFASARLLRSHRRVHSDAKPHACRYCPKRFRHESTRNTHHRTHTGEKPYICAACGKAFIQNSNLTLHMRTHTGEKPYSCSKCEQKFTSRSSLKAHLRRHTGEKPYSCDVCGKKFARMDLSAHKRLHAGARPHACSACPKAFVNAARLRSHCRMHTGEKPFECATCGKTFAAKSHLAQHVKKHQSTKKQDKKDIVIVQQVAYNGQMFVSNIITDGKQNEQTEEASVIAETKCEEPNNDITLELAQDMPLEVTGELVVQDDCDVKEILVVDNSHNETSYQSGNVCLNTGEIGEINYSNSDVNLVTVNEGTTVKLYQLDQSLVQIHSSGGQVTISKITSKMTANF
ncbi:zinc finger protein 813-like isoform X1 [Ostrinia nubilalis]|uniref:zinc finger protein 813-like isoform X1 n=2 Tax=Ostrinia nubilalis TaxID=29057 RepID=UPI0030823464